MKLNTQNLSRSIRKLAKEYKISPRKINCGCCADFASVIWDRFSRPKELEFGSYYDYEYGHTYLIFEGLCYDAEKPNGVKDWQDLPSFRGFKK